MMHDLHFAFRMLLKHKGFTAVAIIALARRSWSYSR